MTNKIANVSFETQKIDAPHGVVLGGYTVTLFLSGAVVGTPVTVADKTVPVEIVITAPGTGYTIQVARVSSTGEAVSAPSSSAPFDIAPDQVEVPLSVTVTLSDPTPAVEVPVHVAVNVGQAVVG